MQNRTFKSTKTITVITIYFLIAVFLSCSKKPVRHPFVLKGDYAYFKRYMSWFIKEEMNSNGLVGMSIAFIDNDQVAWKKGFGYADTEKKRKVKPETNFKIASLSKLFTGTAIMQLVEKDLIDLDRPVTDYIPDFSIKSRFKDTKPITVRMLMTHHSGIPSDKGHGLFDENPESYKFVVEYLKDQYLSYPPGYIYCYSNLGVCLLGLIIERVSGDLFSDYIQQSILEPLQMNTSYVSNTYKRDKAMAMEYSGGKQEKGLVARDLPSAGMISNINDLSKFLIMMMQEGTYKGTEILDDDTVEDMLEEQNDDNPMDFNRIMGLIWHISRPSLNYDGKVCMHRGISLYHRSEIVYLPDEKLGIIVLCNTDTGTEPVRKIVDQALLIALEQQRKIKPKPKPVADQVNMSDDEKRFITGEYATLKGLVKIKLIGDSLWAEITDRIFKLIPREDDMFSLQYSLFGIVPHSLRIGVKVFNGRKILILEQLGLKMAVGEEYRVKSLPYKWKKRCGKYKIINVQKTFHLLDEGLSIAVVKGSLVGETYSSKFGIGKLNFIIEPLNSTEAVIKGIGRSGEETLFVRNINGEEFIEYSGYFFSKVQ